MQNNGGSEVAVFHVILCAAAGAQQQVRSMTPSLALGRMSIGRGRRKEGSHGKIFSVHQKRATNVARKYEYYSSIRFSIPIAVMVFTTKKSHCGHGLLHTLPKLE